MAGLEEEIADLQDIVNNPGRIKKLIVAELQAVQKKYAVPRRTEIVYEYQTAAAEDAEDETPDYPVHVSAPGRATSRRSPPSPCA